MKSGPFRTIVLLFFAVLAFYLIAYRAIEYRRARNGPWTVTFTIDHTGAPLVRIDQPTLGITNVQLVLTQKIPSTNRVAKTIRFERPQPVPFELPYGDCIFMDTTFLPGSVVMRLEGHEIQLIPRVLTIDGQERPWRSDELISITTLKTNVEPFLKPNAIPARFQGEFAFDKPATVAYWESQSDWPAEVKERLTKMAIPTTVRIEIDRVIVTDVASGQSVTQHAVIRHVGTDMMELELHSNFAQTNRPTTFQFDAGGFWLCEGTLVPNYRERFKKIGNP